MWRASRANAIGSALSRLPIDGRRNPGRAKLVAQRPAARERRDMHVEAVARQSARQDQELLLGPGPVERRNDVKNAGQGGEVSCWSGRRAQAPQHTAGCDSDLRSRVRSRRRTRPGMSNTT